MVAAKAGHLLEIIIEISSRGRGPVREILMEPKFQRGGAPIIAPAVFRVSVKKVDYSPHNILKLLSFW
jgi:hypothetical protein